MKPKKKALKGKSPTESLYINFFYTGAEYTEDKLPLYVSIIHMNRKIHSHNTDSSE